MTDCAGGEWTEEAQRSGNPHVLASPEQQDVVAAVSLDPDIWRAQQLSTGSTLFVATRILSRQIFTSRPNPCM